MSPGWFAQAHEVRQPFTLENLLTLKQGPNHKLVVSPPLQNNGNALKWLEANSQVHTLIGGILMVLQPELFRIGCNALEELAANPYHVGNVQHLPAALRDWNLPFNGIAIISNRLTPLHRDTYGRKEWLDILVALGEYTHGRLEIPAFNIAFQYDPGCLAAGRLLRHGATCEGERACIAYYMRNNVMERLGQEVVSWNNINDYQQLVAQFDIPGYWKHTFEESIRGFDC